MAAIGISSPTVGKCGADIDDFCTGTRARS